MAALRPLRGRLSCRALSRCPRSGTCLRTSTRRRTGRGQAVGRAAAPARDEDDIEWLIAGVAGGADLAGAHVHRLDLARQTHGAAAVACALNQLGATQ